MKFICCGVVYSTENPETFWCIEKYTMKKPEKDVVNDQKVIKEIIFTLFCKKNGCSKLEVHRYGRGKEQDILLEKEIHKGKGARAFLERTKDMRIRQPQCCPLKKVPYAKNIPWVYGKAVGNEAQRARYLDETGNRDVFKDQMWQSDIFTSKIHSYNS